MPHHQTATIRDIVRMIGEAAPPPDKSRTVDSFKCGNPDLPITSIAVTFMATREVLDRAVECGANLLITHEPTFYNHLDESGWISNDPVFLSKKHFLKERGLVLWRFHDGIHRLRPDGILQGMVRRLGWQMPEDPERPNLCQIPALSLRDLARHCRKALGIGPVRVAGDPDLPCSRVGLLPGACGGRRQMDLLCTQGANVVICGESPEWETCEYVRDATQSGFGKGLIVLGHANSEEAGVEYCAEWLRTLLPSSIQVRYIPAGDPFVSV